MAKSFWLFGGRATIHADQGDTAGRYDLVEGGGPPGFQTPLHRHNRYVEQIYVLEGEFTVWAGQRMAVLYPGDVFTIPACTAHALAITGDRPGRALIIASPSGFARVLMGAGTPDTGAAPPAGPPNMALFERLCAEVGDEILGPPGALPEEDPILSFADNEKRECATAFCFRERESCFDFALF
jgi:quercetin dioxygenase-like cupin family protein